MTHVTTTKEEEAHSHTMTSCVRNVGCDAIAVAVYFPRNGL